MQGWLSGIWASVPTPFHANGDLRLQAIPSVVEHFSSSIGLAGIYCNGIMGEGWALSIDERKDVVAAWASASSGRLKLGVVVTAGSLKETIDLAIHAHDVGAHHIVVAPPPGHYSCSELVGYVRMVHAAASLPLVVVQTSSGGFGLDVVRGLARESGVVSGIKLGASHGDLLPMFEEFGDVVTITDPLEVHWLSNLQTSKMDVLYADPEPYLFQTAKHKPIQTYYNAFMSGRIAEAHAVSRQLQPFREIYSQWIMRPLLGGVAPVGALKAWCAFLGLDVGPPRLPLLPLGEEESGRLYRQIDAALKSASWN